MAYKDREGGGGWWGRGQTWAPLLMSANGQWKRGNKTQVKCNGKAKQQGEVLHTGQNNTQTTTHTPTQTVTHTNTDSNTQQCRQRICLEFLPAKSNKTSCA